MSIEVGQKLQGKVASITSFGVFVDIGSKKNGLVHISQVSNEFVADIHEILSVGDEVCVKVLSISDEGKVSLSMKEAADKPAVKKDFPKKEKREIKPKNPTFSKKNEEINEGKQDFDSLMSTFLKDSSDRLLSLKRNTEGKRGGRGGRRS